MTVVHPPPHPRCPMARTLPTEPVSPYKLSHVALRTTHLDEVTYRYELLLNARSVFDRSRARQAIGGAGRHLRSRHRLAPDH
jgi:hypothetical protein